MQDTSSQTQSSLTFHHPPSSGQISDLIKMLFHDQIFAKQDDLPFRFIFSVPSLANTQNYMGGHSNITHSMLTLIILGVNFYNNPTHC